MSPNQLNNKTEISYVEKLAFLARMEEALRRRDHKHQSGSRKTGGFGKPKFKYRTFKR